MKRPFPYDMRAVLMAAGKGFSLKKIVATSLFLLQGYVLYALFTYLALIADGVRFDYIWQSYGPFPLRLYPFDSNGALILQVAGLLLALGSVFQAIMAGAVITFEEIRGDYFYSLFDAIRFTLRRTATLALGFLSLGAFIGFIVLLGSLTGLIARIPSIGEAVIGFFYLFPIFLVLSLTLFVVFVAVTSVVFLPIIVAAQKENELFGPLLHLFSVMIKEPVRFFGYLFLSSAIAKVASFVLAYFFFRTIQFSHLILRLGGGAKIDRMFRGAMTLLPIESPTVTFICNVFPGIPFGFTFSRFGYGGEFSIGAVLLAISFFFLFMIIMGYMTSVVSSGMAYGYAVIRRMKDDYLISDEDPMKRFEDYANPPFENRG